MVYRRTEQVRAREELTRSTILDAARASVAQRGLAGASVADVASIAGVGVGTVYRYFPSKADLIGEVVGDICRHELAVVAEVADPETGTPSERLVGAITVFASRALRSGRVAYAMIAEPTNADIEVLRVEIRADLAAIFAGIVADGVASGDFPVQAPAVSGTALVGAVSEVLVGPLSQWARAGVDTEGLLAEIGRFAIRSIAPEPSRDQAMQGVRG